MKKHKQHIVWFLCDHLWVIILFFLGSLITWFVFNLVGGSTGDVLYYAFLPIILLVLALLYRLYSTWSYYEYLLQDVISHILRETHCQEAKRLSDVIGQFQARSAAQSAQSNENQKMYKLMIYQWVHQMKTPLSVVNLLTQNHPHDADWKKTRNAVQEMQYDLNQLLSLYRLDKLESDFRAETVSLSKAVRESINELKSSFIEREVYPNLDVCEDITVKTDVKWLRFILYQLLTNAIKYSPSNSKVTVSAQEDQKHISMMIEDKGCGIPSEDISRVFDLFFTGENGRIYGESSGIGLYMAKRVADYLGHELSVSSTPGEGTTFIIKF